MNDISPPETASPVEIATSTSAKICFTISLAILAVGFCVATGIHSKMLPFLLWIGAHPLQTLGVVVAAGGVIFLGYLYFTSVIALHVMNNLALLAGVGVLSYLLGVQVNYKGDTVLNIWGLGILELGFLAFVTCYIRHNGETIKDFSIFLGMCQGAFLFILSGCWAISSNETLMDHFHEARTQFGEQHKGQISTPIEPFEYKGRTFKCSMVGGKADCEFPY